MIYLAYILAMLGSMASILYLIQQDVSGWWTAPFIVLMLTLSVSNKDK